MNNYGVSLASICVFVFISMVIPYLWVLITPALLAFFYNGAVYYLVQVERGKTPDLEVESF